MKPAPFDYYAPTSVDEALDVLTQLGYGGKVLAGGQSLIPAMNFRMAQPAALVDLNKVKELSFIRQTNDGGLLIGTMTRDSVVEHDPIVQQKAPLIGQAMPFIAHPQIRNRGTFGGAMAHADPAGQLPGVAVAMNMRMHIRSKKGERWVNADDFFMGPFTSVLEPEEMLVEVAIPPMPAHSGTSFQQVSRQRGSQAQVAVAVMVTMDGKRCKAANIVLLCVGERPTLMTEAVKLVVGQESKEEVIKAVAKHVATKEIEPAEDIHATEDYRRFVAEELVVRALTEAFKAAAR